MVDPNRKINRLTDENVEFLDECDEEFETRFSQYDEDFMAHCKRPLDEPPVIFNTNSGHRNRFGGGHRRHAGSGHHNNYRYGSGAGAGAGSGSNNNYRHGSGPGHHNNYRHGSKDRQARHYPDRDENRSRMEIPRNYANFVPASVD